MPHDQPYEGVRNCNVEVEVTFIRHAESEENVKTQHLYDAIKRLFSLKLPTGTQISEILRLLELDLDAEVSVQGKRQIMDMKMMLETKSFWKDFSPNYPSSGAQSNKNICAPTSEDNDSSHGYGEGSGCSSAGVASGNDACTTDKGTTHRQVDEPVIVYSPLKRTLETCRSLIPDKYQGVCVELDLLREIHPLEYLAPARVAARMAQLEGWIAGCGARRVLLVGHCQFFKRLLGMKVRMRNCDVWRATLSYPASVGGGSSCSSSDAAKGGTIIRGKWSHLRLLHRTALTTKHPLDSIFKWLRVLYRKYMHPVIGLLRPTDSAAVAGAATGGQLDEEDDSDGDDNFREGSSSRDTAGRVPTAVERAGSGEEEVEDDLDDLRDEPLCRICQVGR